MAPQTGRRQTMTQSDAAPQSGRPLVFRGGTVLTMDDASTVLTDADVLVVDDRIAAVGAAAATCPRAPRRSTPPAAS